MTRQTQTKKVMHDAPLAVRRIVKLLERVYGPKSWRKHRDGVGGLVQTILSQNTSDTNSHAAFRSLRRRFASWKKVAEAPVSHIERAIRCGGLSRTKAPRIRAALRSIQARRGRLSLAHLARMPLDEARAELEAIAGVGPKTACCVLMFCYGRPALPVDTHVHRVARRLGLISPRCTAAAAHRLLESQCPPDQVYPFHVLMVEHGRTTCRATQPRCSECSLARSCPEAQQLSSRANTTLGSPFAWERAETGGGGI